MNGFCPFFLSFFSSFSFFFFVFSPVYLFFTFLAFLLSAFLSCFHNSFHFRHRDIELKYLLLAILLFFPLNLMKCLSQNLLPIKFILNKELLQSIYLSKFQEQHLQFLLQLIRELVKATYTTNKTNQAYCEKYDGRVFSYL